MRQRRADVLAKPNHLRDLLFDGSARARKDAAGKMDRVREAMKLRYR